VVLYSKVRGW